MNNWQYAQNVPTERWRSAMTLPRELILRQDEQGYILTSIPVVETELLRAERLKLEPGPLRGRNNVGPDQEGGHPLYEIDLVFEFDPEEEEGVEFGIILESNKHEKLIAAFNTRTQQVFIARDSSGKIDFSKHFPGMHTAPYQDSKEGEIRFHAFVDLSSIELFVDQGALVMSELCFPESGFEKIHLYSSKESVRLKKGDIYSLKSAR
jgi:fructan beta-fructosidase